MALLTALLVMIAMTLVGVAVCWAVARDPTNLDDAAGQPAPEEPLGGPGRTEALLVSQLIRGQLSRTEYHDAMAGLAALDARGAQFVQRRWRR